MKKQYTQPELYVETIEVEQGIAVSEPVFMFGNEDTGFDVYLNEDTLDW